MVVLACKDCMCMAERSRGHVALEVCIRDLREGIAQSFWCRQNRHFTGVWVQMGLQTRVCMCCSVPPCRQLDVLSTCYTESSRKKSWVAHCTAWHWGRDSVKLVWVQTRLDDLQVLPRSLSKELGRSLKTCPGRGCRESSLLFLESFNPLCFLKRTWEDCLLLNIKYS